MEAAQYESLGRSDDALLVKMLQAGLIKLKAGAHSASARRPGPLILTACAAAGHDCRVEMASWSG